ncbi:MAG TPA: GxxExxY protein [Bryobacteraceae bacterium]|nr:GxxExxY protein [Bryobacteraceae bacterium]
MRIDPEIRGEYGESGEECAESGVSTSFENELTRKAIGAAIEVHRHLGPGLLESAYEECLCCELSLLGVRFQRQVSLPVNYKGVLLDCSYRIDVLVENAVILEIKSVEGVLPIHQAQLLTYLRIAEKRVGLIINFNVSVLKDGLKRMVNQYTGPAPEPSPLSDSLVLSPRLTPRFRVSAVKKESH